MKARRRRADVDERPLWDAPRRIPSGSLVAFDTETTGINFWQGDEPYAFSWCNDKGETGYIEWPVCPYTRVVLRDEREADMIREWAADHTIAKVMHNGKFDRFMCECAFGAEWRGELIDTLLAAHCCNSMENSYGLKPLTEKYCDVSTDDQKELKKATERARKHGKTRGWVLTMTEKAAQDDIAKGVIEPFNYARHQGSGSPLPPDYWMVPLHSPDDGYLVKKYAVLDAYRTMMLWWLFRSLMNDDDTGHMWSTFRMEQELEGVVERMERRGIHVDDDRLQSEEDECIRERDEALQVLLDAVDGHTFDGKPFSPSNDGHLRWLLYEQLGLAVTKKTKKTGIPSVAQPTLMGYLDEPVVQALFKYNIADKGATDFFGNYRRLKTHDVAADTSGWVLHPNFKQFEQKTARFACQRPNLQNVPDAISTRSARPIQGRIAFGPRPGYRWYLMDYSQLEVRIFADVSQEPTLLNALATGRDLHTECANKAWGGEGNGSGNKNIQQALMLDGVAVGSIEEETQELLNEAWSALGVSQFNDHGLPVLSFAEASEFADVWLQRFDYDIVAAEKAVGKKNTRAKAKMVLFARMFGGGPNAIKDLMGVTYDQAKGFMDDYNRAFPGIVQYINARTAEATRDGGIYNCYNRWLVTPEGQEYKSVNYTVQGSAADLIKRAMVKCDRYLRERGLDAHLVLTIHDEIVFEFAHAASRRNVLRDLKAIMEDHEGAFNIPTPVDMERADVRWPEKEGVKWIAS